MDRSSAAGFGLFVRQHHRRRVPAVGLAGLAGVLQAASLAWPFAMPQTLAGLGLAQGQPCWWGQVLALSILAGLVSRSLSWQQAAWRAWFFSTTWLACTFAWLFTSMHTYGGLPAPLALLAVLALAAVLALYYAGACGIYRALALTQTWSCAIVFASLWLLAELARGLLFSGFGWGAIGYAQLDGPLAAGFAWVGLYGVSWVAAALSALLAQILSVPTWSGRALQGGVLTVLMVMPVLLPAPAVRSAGVLDVTLLQGNIAQEEKFEANTGVLQALRWYGEQLRANRSTLIVTPETALPLLPEQLPQGYWQALQQRFASGEQAVLIGIPLGSYAEGYTNSVVGFKPGQTQAWRYDKHHLVPFGEFIPPFFRWFTDLMAIPLGDFNRGGLPQPTFDWHGQRLAATICYENLFSEELATQFVDVAKAPTLFVNISNLGWFGERLAMDQHLQITRARALEFDRPFLLATNTGQTAIVNHRGMVTHAAKPHTAVALQGQVQGRSGITPYAQWVARFGLWPLALLALAVVAATRWRQTSNSG